MARCTATAVREGRWWVVEVDGVGVTQGRNVTQVHEMAHALIVDLLEIPAGEVEVEVTFEVPGLQGAVERAKTATREAAQAQLQAAEGAREIARQLSQRGLSAAEVAAVLQVSRSRAQQLARTA